MSSKPKFYLPVILPPLKDQGDPPAYYAGIKTLGVDATTNSPGDGSLEIAIANPNLLHPSSQFDQPLPFSTVFAPTSGFVRFYPGSAPLPTPNPAAIPPPPGLTPTDIGSVIIRVWISNFADFIKTPSVDPARANRIALCWLQPSTVKPTFETEIHKLNLKVLEKSWKDAGGTGVTPNRTVLEGAFLARFMQGQVEVFVSAGAQLGSAAIVGTDAKLKLHTFFQPEDAATASLFVEPDDVLDNAANETLLNSHPVLLAANAPIQITFKSKFTIWNDQSRNYEALANTLVTLMTAPDNITIDAQSTDNNGRLNLTPQDPLAKRDLIFFSYDTTGKTVGSRTLDRDIETERHFARQHLNSNHENTREYQASDDIYPAFRDFVDELASNADNEQFERDRGNGATHDSSNAFSPPRYTFTFASQKGFLMRVRDSEKRYKTPPVDPQKTFTLLVEGDSWFSYPPDGHGSFIQYSGDIYGQLDLLLEERLEKPIPKLATYLRFPLQHHGDRSDQMFAGDLADPTRQWYFTRRFLTEFKIDAALCSSGGNDIAEPGISHWVLKSKTNSAKALSKCFTDPEFSHSGERGYFDPSQMDEKQLTPDQQELARQLMEKSFAILLIDHPWNVFARTAPVTKPSVLWSALPGWNQLGTDEKDHSIGAKVITHIADFEQFPDPEGDVQQKLLATVFDSVRYKERFARMKENWEIMLTAAQAHGTRVVTHTYCYPLFSQFATSVLPPVFKAWQTGPWFGPRFKEAEIDDFRIRYICLKAVLDNYKYLILDKLTAQFQGTFEYVDVRSKAPSSDLWADEMHLNSNGFKPIAARLYNRIAAIIEQRLGIDLPMEAE